jgi:transposase-like protein
MPCHRCQRTKNVIKKGFYSRGNGPSKTRRRVQRFYCKSCGHFFSALSGHLDERQKRPDLHGRIYSLLISGVSQRRIALLCATTQVTVSRKLVRLARFSRQAHAERLSRMRSTVSTAIFDEMETFEHTKCKPVAIAVAVEEGSRIILAAEAASMPAKGLLAKVSRRRYGRRADLRRGALKVVLMRVSDVGGANILVKSDECPRYPTLVKKYLPRATHKTFKGRRGCVVGQGELKAGGRDPLFSLNHSCAMIRDNVKSLSRRTWCTTKRIDRLQCRLDLYVCAHNELVERKGRRQDGGTSWHAVTVYRQVTPPAGARRYSSF